MPNCVTIFSKQRTNDRSSISTHKYHVNVVCGIHKHPQQSKTPRARFNKHIHSSFVPCRNLQNRILFTTSQFSKVNYTSSEGIKSTSSGLPKPRTGHQSDYRDFIVAMRQSEMASFVLRIFCFSREGFNWNMWRLKRFPACLHDVMRCKDGVKKPLSLKPGLVPG